MSILRGEKSFPVMLTTFTCIHKETKEKIRYEDYKKLSEKEQELYNVFPKMQVFRVFNVARPTCGRRGRSCGKSWSRRSHGRKSRTGNI